MITQIEQLTTLDRSALLSLWQERYNCPPAKGLSAPMICRLLVFDQQAQGHKRQMRALERFSKQKGTTPKRDPIRGLKAGSQIIREWNGKTHKVNVLKKGFEWQGQPYRSLSAIAKAITGTHHSGPRFFGLKTLKTSRSAKGNAPYGKS